MGSCPPSYQQRDAGYPQDVDTNRDTVHISSSYTERDNRGWGTTREGNGQQYGSDSVELNGDASESVADSKDTSVVTVIYHGNDNINSTGSVGTGHRRFPSVDEDEDEDNKSEQTNNNNNDEPSSDEKPVTWSSLPKKGQLAILTFARLSEPLTQTSLQAYMFYQLKSFDSSLPDSTISAQAGILQGSFTAAQFLTAVLWGRLADAEWMGRKRVLLIGLLGTCISCLGFGFSRSFVAAAVFRTLGGVLNSNIGVMRTMIAEIIDEKK